MIIFTLIFIFPFDDRSFMFADRFVLWKAFHLFGGHSDCDTFIIVSTIDGVPSDVRILLRLHNASFGLLRVGMFVEKQLRLPEFV